MGRRHVAAVFLGDLFAGAGTSVRRAIASRSYRRVVLVSGGAAMGQVVAVLSVPVLTRLYDPVAFGLFGVFMAISLPGSTIACLRIEQAIVLPADEDEARNLLRLCCWVAPLTAIVFGIAAWLASGVGMIAGVNPIWLAATTLVAGLTLPFMQWAVRAGAFRRISIAVAARAIAIPVAQMCFGVAQWGATGLMVGQAAGELTAFVILFGLAKGDGAFRRRDRASRTAGSLLRQYADFLLFSAPQAFLNTLSQGLPALILSAHFGASVVGAYTISLRTVLLPATAVGQAVRQVSTHALARAVNAGEMIYDPLRRATLGLTIASGIPVLGIVLFSPTICDVVFGAEWRAVGTYAPFLAPWAAMMLINIPSVSTLTIIRHQKTSLLYDTSMIVLRTTALFTGVLVGSDTVAVCGYGVVGVVMNLMLIRHTLNIARIWPAEGPRESVRLSEAR